MATNIHRETLVGETFPETRKLPFYPMLPKDKVGLLKFRLYVRERCLEDKDFRDKIVDCCRHDVAFFTAVFVYFHETRATEETLGKFPVCPWPDQVDILAAFQDRVGTIDITVEKTRGIGLSYLACVYLLWAWLYRGESLDFGLLSKDESSLDIPGRPGSLMGKLDLMYAELPAWMKLTTDGRPLLKRTEVKHVFLNQENKNCILGFVPTNEKLRSARLFTLFADEAAFLPIDTQAWLSAAYGTVPSIVWISTHKGRATLFYRLTRDTEHRLFRISTWWHNNVKCRAGLYKSVAGRIEIIDTDYNYAKLHPEGYNFSHEHAGFYRSPWVDRAFQRPGIDAQQLFEELYGLAAIESRKLIRQSIIDKGRAQCMAPLMRGHVSPEGEFIESDSDGDIHLWQLPGTFSGRYWIGVDPSLGAVGGAYAGLCAIDGKTGSQVVSAQLKECTPAEFAKVVIGVAKLLCGSRGSGFTTIVYESTGTNTSFATELNTYRWPSIFCGSKDRPGVHNADRGMAWLNEIGSGIDKGEVSIRDKRIIQDLEDFEVDSKKWELIFAGTKGHGDLGIATALCWWAARQFRRNILKSEEYNTIGPTNLTIEDEPRMVQYRQRAKVWSNKFR